MGRGGKKKGKKEDVGDADDGKPSTSEETSKLTADMSSLSIAQKETKISDKPVTAGSDPLKPDDDDDDGGLGLGSSKGRRKKKPKGASAQSISTQKGQAQSAVAVQTFSVPVATTSQSQSMTIPQHAAATTPQHFDPQYPPDIQTSSGQQVGGVPTAAQIPPSASTPWIRQPVATQAPTQQAGVGRGRGRGRQEGNWRDNQRPGPTQPTDLTASQAPRTQHEQSPTLYSQSSDSSKPGIGQPYPAEIGRGGGQGQQQGRPGQQQGRPGLPQGRPGLPQSGDFTASHVQRTPHAQSPAPSSQSSDSSRSGSRQQTMCRFQIPNKNLTPEVPAAKIKVIVNYLRMKFSCIKVFRYDVSIKPDKPKKMVPKVYQIVKEKHFKIIPTAFDQKKNLFAIKMLTKSATEPLNLQVEVLDDNNVKMPFEVTIKYTGFVDFGTIMEYMRSGGSTLEMPMEAIQCIDVVLQQATVQSYVKAGRQYFRRPNNPVDLGQGMEMWTGLFQSAIFNSGSYINIDVAHKGFPRSQSLLDAVVNDFRMDLKRPLDRQPGSEDLKHFLKGLRVTALLGGDTKSGRKREFICNGLVDSAVRLTFPMTDASGKTVKCTVNDYFQKVKNYRLKYPEVNCLWVGVKDKNIYYPLELLEVVHGQAINKQLSSKQLPIMVREAATAPNIRKDKIKEVIQNMHYSTNPHFKQFGLEISDKLTEIDAKVLPVPKINVGAGRYVEPRRGAWQANGFVQAQALQRWAILLVDGNPRYCQIHPTVDMIINVGRKMGMNIDKPMAVMENVSYRDLLRTLEDIVRKGVNFVFVVVAGRDNDLYHKVKRVAELDVGVLTQCIKEFTVNRKMNEQTMRNILLKVNSKLMGVNQVLDKSCMPKCLQGGGVMLVGADVTHPSPDQSNVPSIAAVTASIDTNYFRYNIELSVQTPKKEMIVQFEDMMVDHFKVYQKHNGNTLPHRIYVLRDGVSDGQFAEVMNDELVALQRAHERMSGPMGKKPEILFVLVQKRHHTRLFTADRVAQNVDPGTVVDTEIVHQRELNFFLVSHQAIKGTARPTRYHAVCNDSNLSVSEVEQLAFYLCHLYSRCTRSVSYPTPTYYAHLACLRARSLTHGDRFDNRDLEKNPKRIHVLDKMLQFSRMFFV